MPHHRTAQAQVRFDVAKSNMAAVDPRWLPPARQMYHPASVELLKSKMDVKMHQNVKIVEKYMQKNATSISIYKGYMYITLYNEKKYQHVPTYSQIFMNQVLRNWRFNRRLRHRNDPMQQQFCLCLPSNCLAIIWTLDSEQTLQCHMHSGKHRKNIVKPEGRSCHHPPAVCQVLCPQQRLHHMRHSQ